MIGFPNRGSFYNEIEVMAKYIHDISRKCYWPAIKWIGSKRVQAESIIRYFPSFIDTYYEPFCGGCFVLMNLLKSKDHHVGKCICSDINGDLIDLFNTLKNDPKGLTDEYSRMWEEMHSLSDVQDRKSYFEIVRTEFNQTRSPYCFFFLMKTCTNGVPRYNRWGEYNSTFHLSREGMKPKTLDKIVVCWNRLLTENDVEFKRCDYRKMFDAVEEDNFMYLDPPYEITRSTGRYFGDLDYYDLFDRIRCLNGKGVKYALSFSPKNRELMVPEDIYVDRFEIRNNNFGYRRTVLNKGSDETYESLYLN